MNVELVPYEPPEEWERLPRESAAEFAAFVVYRDTPPLERSMGRISSETGIKAATLGSWATRNDWKHRSLAWDDHIDEVRRLEMADRVQSNARLFTDRTDRAMQLLSEASEEWERRRNSDDIVEREDAKLSMRTLSASQLLSIQISASRPIILLWEAQQEAMGIAVQHFLIQKRAERQEDPFATDEEYAEAVMKAFVEAGVIPDPSSGAPQTSPAVPSTVEGGTPEGTPEILPKPRHRRRVSKPTGRIERKTPGV